MKLKLFALFITLAKCQFAEYRRVGMVIDNYGRARGAGLRSEKYGLQILRQMLGSTVRSSLNNKHAILDFAAKQIHKSRPRRYQFRPAKWQTARSRNIF